MKHFPLLFTYRDLIGGDGFFASVEVYGRALLEENSEDVWMCGLNPGGIAGGGQTRREALSDFRRAYTSVLLDIAHAAKVFDEFKQEAEIFFNDTCRQLEQQWDDAVAQVRQGNVDAKWLQKHEFSNSEIRITVVDIFIGQ